MAGFVADAGGARVPVQNIYKIVDNFLSLYL